MGSTGVCGLQCCDSLPYAPNHGSAEGILCNGLRLHHPLGFVARFLLHLPLGQEPQPSLGLRSLMDSGGTYFPHYFRVSWLTRSCPSAALTCGWHLHTQACLR